MERTNISIGEHTFDVWLAQTPEQRELGLMQVEQEELAPIADPQNDGQIYRGMLFVFETDAHRSFWMYNTIIPLDIAYIRSDGEIVSIHTMAPLETRSYPSGEPARFALEAPAGLFDELGIDVGQQVQIPEAVLKASG
jgi:hypothetical protein